LWAGGPPLGKTPTRKNSPKTPFRAFPKGTPKTTGCTKVVATKSVEIRDGTTHNGNPDKKVPGAMEEP